MNLRILLLALFILCAHMAQAGALAPFSDTDAPPPPDYAKSDSWLAIPDKPGKHPVDIFWVYPTILADNEHWLMNPADTGLQARAANTLRTQASVFSGQANLYAPLYRQMNLAGLSLGAQEQGRIIAYGTEDVWRAFTYYLEHLNNGRPFILAGHSQGSNILTALAIKHWGTTGAENRLIAAYLIGWSITGNDLKTNPKLKMCASAAQINCFISYNSVAEGRQQVAPTIRAGAVVTNPLNWSISNEFAPASLNLGAKLFMPDGTTKCLPHFTSAQSWESGLVVDPANPALVPIGDGGFPKGVYHQYDYSLFFENLRSNAARRIQTYLSQHNE